MALAILELVDADETKVAFRIDAGTNTQYQLQFGRATREQDEGDWIDDVYYTTPAREIDGGAGFYAQPVEVNVPLKAIERGRGFVQLFTSKAGGKAHAYSDVLALPGAGFIESLSISRSLSDGAGSGTAMTILQPHKPIRQVANRTAPVSRQASIEKLLGEIVKIASPIVINLLKGAPAANGATTVAASASNDSLVQVLKSIIDAISAPAGSPPMQQPVSQPKSLVNGGGNRLLPGGSHASYAKPFIFGIDDALIASLAGPLIQVLPQILNAANQKRIDLKKADNALISGIISDINKRLMMDKLLQAQQAAEAQGPAAPISEEQIKVIADLLAQTPTQQVPAGTGTVTAPLAGAKSITAESAPPYDLGAKALLAFTFPTTLEWNGKPMPVFDRTGTIVLRPRFTVVEQAPKSPLAKAILKLAVYDGANQATRYEKIFKLKGVLANTEIECRFEPGELSHLPAGCKLCVVGELRWKSERSGRQTRVLGSAEIVLAGKYFLKSLDLAVSEERELNDMAQFRPFWNKIWEAPALDRARKTEGVTKYAWDFNMNGRYTALLTASHDLNGMMETRLLTEADDPNRPTLNIHGRMKAGIEISIRELNKLLALWKRTPLDPAKLEALGTRDFLDGAAREFKYNFKLKGRVGQSGMIWVIPVLKLYGLTFSSIAAANQNGQVTATAEETLQFPLPVAARLIGLKSAA